MLGKDRSYFVKKNDSTNKLSETHIINILEFLIDNIFVMFGGSVFQQVVGMHACTTCTPLLVDLFLHSFEADFIQGFLKKNEKYLARFFDFTFRYIEDVLPLINYRLGDFIDGTHPIDLEIKDTTEK